MLKISLKIFKLRGKVVVRMCTGVLMIFTFLFKLTTLIRLKSLYKLLFWVVVYVLLHCHFCFFLSFY